MELNLSSEDVFDINIGAPIQLHNLPTNLGAHVHNEGNKLIDSTYRTDFCVMDMDISSSNLSESEYTGIRNTVPNITTGTPQGANAPYLNSNMHTQLQQTQIGSNGMNAGRRKVSFCPESNYRYGYARSCEPVRRLQII